MKLEKIRCCDICNEFDAPYVWMFKSQVFPAGTDIDFLMECIENPEWFACKRCHELLLKQDYVALVKTNPDALVREREPYFMELYKSLVMNIK